MSLLDSALAALRTARDWFADALDSYFNEGGIPPTTVEEAIAQARQGRGDDARKKQELAAFFQTPEGSRYSKAERKAAYDELLGARINSQIQG